MVSFLRLWAMFLALLMLAGCGLWGEEEWQQRVIIEVETPQGLVIGESVQSVKFSIARFSVPDGPDRSLRASGQAVVVDLGSAGVLFALLKGEKHFGDAGNLAPIAFFGLHVQPGYTSEPAIKKVLATPRGKRTELPREAYPLLVTFTDIDDPKTVRRVDPDDLAATFAPGVSLRRIMVEITDSEVTSRVPVELPWICQLLERQARLNGKTGPISDNELSNNLGAGHFRTEKCT